MLSFLTLAGVVTTDLGVGDTGFVGDPVLLLASSTLLAAGREALWILKTTVLQVIHFYFCHLQLC